MVRTALFLAVALLTGAAGTAGTARAAITAKIDIGSQTMQVFVDGKLRHSWTVSTGRRGHETPTGTYRPQRLERDWHSRKYDAPMPHSVFFSGGYAIHGSYDRVGGPASRGCVRLSPGNAARFYDLVASRGARNTRIEIDD